MDNSLFVCSLKVLDLEPIGIKAIHSHWLQYVGSGSSSSSRISDRGLAVVLLSGLPLVLGLLALLLADRRLREDSVPRAF